MYHTRLFYNHWLQVHSDQKYVLRTTVRFRSAGKVANEANAANKPFPQGLQHSSVPEPDKVPNVHPARSIVRVQVPQPLRNSSTLSHTAKRKLPTFMGIISGNELNIANMHVLKYGRLLGDA